MIILIPFYLLSLHKIIKKKRSKETLEQLKRLIFNDILGSIEMNYEYGNITMDDADSRAEIEANKAEIEAERGKVKDELNKVQKERTEMIKSIV